MKESLPPFLKGIAALLGLIAVAATAFFSADIKAKAEALPSVATTATALEESRASSPRPEWFIFSEGMTFSSLRQIDSLHADMQRRGFIERFADNPVSVALSWLSGLLLMASSFVDWAIKRKK